MKINSYYPVICVENVKETAVFYKKHLEFTAVFENDWYIHLRMKDDETVNLAILASNHVSIPEARGKQAQGFILTFELDEVDDLYTKLKDQNVTILHEPRDEPLGATPFYSF